MASLKKLLQENTPRKFVSRVDNFAQVTIVGKEEDRPYNQPVRLFLWMMISSIVFIDLLALSAFICLFMLSAVLQHTELAENFMSALGAVWLYSFAPLMLFWIILLLWPKLLLTPPIIGEDEI